MSDKKVYAWAYGVLECKFKISTERPDSGWEIIEPLYSIEEVQYVIENNELPKRPVAWVYWDKYDTYKKSVIEKPVLIRYDTRVPVYSADELLAELQKEI